MRTNLCACFIAALVPSDPDKSNTGLISSFELFCSILSAGGP
jgi:hypothetical protein